MAVRSQDILDHIAKAEAVITGWEALGGPSGRTAVALKAITDELIYLGYIMQDTPLGPNEHDPVADLVRRYNDMRLKLLPQENSNANSRGEPLDGVPRPATATSFW